MKSQLQRSFLAIAAIVMAWTIGLSGFATVAGAHCLIPRHLDPATCSRRLR